jgi:dTDP-4-amino-4,6-dideoxygalactose transaminase
LVIQEKLLNKNIMADKIWLSSPHMGGSEKKYIADAFKENWIAPLGPNVNGFEKDIEEYLEDGYAVALSSGTGAIHLALVMLGIKSNDYILASSFTFSATVNPIKYLGANPILIDSENDTWNMDPVLLEKSIIESHSKNIYPKAIILVHLYGMPAKLDEILAISKKYAIPIIEDAAEALGSEYKQKKLGTFGDFGILSFNGNKIITTSGGGALICKTKEQGKHTRFLATQARDDAPHYQHSHIGYNYRMSNVVAGVGRGQMEVITERVKQRRTINQFYKELFSDFKGITFQNEPSEDYYSNFWLTSIIIEKGITGFSREVLRIAFEKENIESRPLWKPMHLQPVFQNCQKFVNGTSDLLFENGLCLPSGSNMTPTQLERIKNVIASFK